MENTNFVIDCKLGLLDYVSMVNNIANEFFDEEGTYTPHIGRINAMRLFYNECVIESKFDIPHDIIDVPQMEILVKDDDFIKAFNDAIEFNGSVCLDFANAYREAIDMVDTRKNSLASAIEVFKGAMVGITEKISPILTESNLDRLTKIADDVSNGNITPEAIAAAYGNSQRITDIAQKG